MTAVVPETPEERLSESLSGSRAPDPPSSAAAPALSPELVALHTRLSQTVFAPFIRQFLDGRRTSLEAERAILEIQMAGVEAQMVLVMADAELAERRLREAAPRRRRRRAAHPTPNEGTTT